MAELPKTGAQFTARTALPSVGWRPFGVAHGDSPAVVLRVLATQVPPGQALFVSPRKVLPGGELEPEADWLSRCSLITGISEG